LIFAEAEATEAERTSMSIADGGPADAMSM
jgi:hypothetical protein